MSFLDTLNKAKDRAKVKKMYRRRFALDIWERYCFWDNNNNPDGTMYAWWPVFKTNYKKFHSMIEVEFQWLKWRCGVSIVIINRLTRRL